MKRSLWALIAVALLGTAVSDEKEKEPPALSLDSTEGFSFDFEPTLDAEPLIYASKDLDQKDVPWLGLWFQETDLLEQALETAGVRIFAVAPLGPAFKAGLRKEDVVTHWNGKAINDADRLRARIASLKIGEEVELTVYRKGEEEKPKFKLKAGNRADYPWSEEWQPYLPTFEAADEVNKLFQEHDEELKAIKAQFEEAEKASEGKAKSD